MISETGGNRLGKIVFDTKQECATNTLEKSGNFNINCEFAFEVESKSNNDFENAFKMTSSKRHSLKLSSLIQVFRRDQMGLKLFVVPIREVFNQCNEVWLFLKIIDRIENVQNWLFLGSTIALKHTQMLSPLQFFYEFKKWLVWLPQLVSFNWRRFSPHLPALQMNHPATFGLNTWYLAPKTWHPVPNTWHPAPKNLALTA